VDELVFCRYWTAKEAVLKATGAGLSGLDRCHVVEFVDARSLRLSFDAAIWTVSHVAAGAAHLAAVTVAPDAVVWHTLEWRDV
jgi:4'-phosphopantetheinyl transferase